MSQSDANNETRETLSRELKSLKEQCVYAFNAIENSPDTLIPNDIESNALNYVEALRTEIHTSNTTITTDDNLLTSQFLSEVKEKTEQVEELIAFTQGSIDDLDAEIERLNILIKTAQEARARPRSEKREIQPHHIKKAKERFRVIKNELHGLIHSLYPKTAELLKEVLAELMQTRLEETSSSYIQITDENYPAIKLLLDMKLVCLNPYNRTEVKLVY